MATASSMTWQMHRPITIIMNALSNSPQAESLALQDKKLCNYCQGELLHVQLTSLLNIHAAEICLFFCTSSIIKPDVEYLSSYGKHIFGYARNTDIQVCRHG